jgi:DNA polymerase III sliding clamp (beta) subunit (PCNA family)
MSRLFRLAQATKADHYGGALTGIQLSPVTDTTLLALASDGFLLAAAEIETPDPHELTSPVIIPSKLFANRKYKFGCGVKVDEEFATLEYLDDPGVILRLDKRNKYPDIKLALEKLQLGAGFSHFHKGVEFSISTAVLKKIQKVLDDSCTPMDPLSFAFRITADNYYGFENDGVICFTTKLPLDFGNANLETVSKICKML